MARRGQTRPMLSTLRICPRNAATQARVTAKVELVNALTDSLEALVSAVLVPTLAVDMERA